MRILRHFVALATFPVLAFGANVGVMFDSSTGAIVDPYTVYSKYLHFTNRTQQLALYFDASTELTIAAGAITVTQAMHTVDGQGDADDDLTTINGAPGEGATLWLVPENAARNITLKHGSGNIVMASGADYTIPDNGAVLLIYDGSNWRAIGASAVVAGTYLQADGTVALTAAWDAGSYQIRAETFQSDVATGTAPLTVASTTAVSNLNADLLDGQHGSYYAATANASQWFAVPFVIPDEPDDDPQHFEIDIDDSADFGSVIVTWDSRDVGDGGDGQTGCVYFNGTQFAAWTSGTGVTAAYEGNAGCYAFQSASISRGTVYYVRVRFHDGTSWGDYQGWVHTW